MNIVIAVAMLLSMLSLLIFQSIKNVRYRTIVDSKAFFATLLLLIDCVLFCLDLMLGGDV